MTSLCLCPDLWVQISEDVHPGLFHHGEQVGVVVGPLHIPHVLALEFGRVSGRGAFLRFPGRAARIDVQERQHSGHVDDGQAAGEGQKRDTML